jgi:RNase P subunit RPR2
MECLTFKCPRTNRIIETGIVTNESTLVRLKGQMLSLRCPSCGQPHKFPIKSGFLAEAA